MPPLRAWVVVEGKFGAIDPSGNLVLPARYEAAGPFVGGLAPVQDGGAWGYLRATGTWALPVAYQQAGPFGSGVAAINRSGWRVELIDTLGQTAVPPRFGFGYGHTLGEAADGVYPALDPSTQRYGLVTVRGDTLLGFDLAYIGPYRNHRAAAVVAGEWVYLDSAGAVVFRAPRGTEALGEWGEGYGWLQREGRWEVVDAAGRVTPIRQSRFEFLEARDAAPPGSFSGGVAAVKVGGKWGYLRPDGSWAIRPQFEAAGPFRFGYAPARHLGRWGYLHPDGRWAIAPQFEYAQPFSR